MVLRAFVILALTGALLRAVPALAQDATDDTAPGRAYATVFSPVPAGVPIAVRAWDNSSENQRVRSSFTDALSKHGVTLTDQKSSLILNFETEVENLAVPSEGPSLGQFQGRNWDSRVRMNIWSNSQDSVLTGRRGESGPPGTTRYILRATLDDDSTGQRLWQGEASYTGAPSDEAATFAAMAPILIDGFGQNLAPKTFRLD